MILYTDNDANCCAWLRNLVAAGLIPTGDVLQADIRELKSKDVKHYDQQHYFCGIGGWPIALGFAGWSPGRQVVTASCPCQPFSVAGKGQAEKDDRHLWPYLFRLLDECRPGIVFGEQVASKLGLAWFDGVCSDLEGSDYTVRACDTCAAGVGAPHIRQRLYWVAESGNAERGRRG